MHYTALVISVICHELSPNQPKRSFSGETCRQLPLDTWECCNLYINKTLLTCTQGFGSGLHSCSQSPYGWCLKNLLVEKGCLFFQGQPPRRNKAAECTMCSLNRPQVQVGRPRGSQVNQHRRSDTEWIPDVPLKRGPGSPLAPLKRVLAQQSQHRLTRSLRVCSWAWFCLEAKAIPANTTALSYISCAEVALEPTGTYCQNDETVKSHSQSI